MELSTIALVVAIANGFATLAIRHATGFTSPPMSAQRTEAT